MLKKIIKNSSDKPIIISLIGMMGSGKTKFGSFLSKKLSYNFYDIDEVIEKNFKKTISEIFIKYGESYFRNEEKKAINFIVNEIINNNQNSIISLGGGGFDNLQTQNLLLSNSLVIWLDCPIKVLIKRIGDGSKRPMLKKDINQTLTDLLNKRTSNYKKAHLTLRSSEVAFKEMTKKILQNI